jgi:hypothetical protein
LHVLLPALLPRRCVPPLRLLLRMWLLWSSRLFRLRLLLRRPLSLLRLSKLSQLLPKRGRSPKHRKLLWLLPSSKSQALRRKLLLLQFQSLSRLPSPRR